MITILLILIYVISIIFIKIKIKDKFSFWASLTFISYWYFCLIISSFNPYKLNCVSFSSYALLVLNISSLLLGFSLISNYHRGNEHPIDVETIITNKYFTCIVVLSIIFLEGLFVKNRALILMSSNIEDAMASDLQKALFAGSAWKGLTFNILIYSLAQVIYFLEAYLLLYRRQWVYIILYGVFIYFFASIGSTRGAYLELIYYMIFLILFKDKIFKSDNDSKKNNFLAYIALGFAFFVIFVMMSYVTALRSNLGKDFNYISIAGGAEKISKQFITYSIGPFRAFDYAMNNNYLDKIGGFKCGLATLGGADEWLSTISQYSGIVYTKTNSSTIIYLQKHWISIGPDTNFNFAYTNALISYFDFGYLGICLIPFIFGYIFRYVICRSYISNSLPIFLLSLFLFRSTIYTVFSWTFVFSWAYTYLLLLFIWNKLRKIKI